MFKTSQTDFGYQTDLVACVTPQSALWVTVLHGIIKYTALFGSCSRSFGYLMCKENMYKKFTEEIYFFFFFFFFLFMTYSFLIDFITSIIPPLMLFFFFFFFHIIAALIRCVLGRLTVIRFWSLQGLRDALTDPVRCCSVDTGNCPGNDSTLDAPPFQKLYM